MSGDIDKTTQFAESAEKLITYFKMWNERGVLDIDFAREGAQFLKLFDQSISFVLLDYPDVALQLAELRRVILEGKRSSSEEEVLRAQFSKSAQIGFEDDGFYDAEEDFDWCLDENDFCRHLRELPRKDARAYSNEVISLLTSAVEKLNEISAKQVEKPAKSSAAQMLSNMPAPSVSAPPSMETESITPKDESDDPLAAQLKADQMKAAQQDREDLLSAFSSNNSSLGGH